MEKIIYRKGQTYELVINSPLLLNGSEYKVYIAPFFKPYKDTTYEFYDTYKAVCKGNELRVKYTFLYEDEYVLAVLPSSAEIDFKNYSTFKSLAIFTERIYAVADDLYSLDVFKVDFHMHSTSSDGKTSPAEICAYCREKGHDIVAITDHNNIDGAKIAIDFYKPVDMDLKLYYGEECQPKGLDPHILSWGANKSVTKYIYEHTDEYEAFIKKTIAERGLNKYTNAYDIASCIFRAQKIREYGGMSVFAHPIWDIFVNALDIDLMNYLIEYKVVDALQLTVESVKGQSLQLAYYYDQALKGNTLPLVGATDAHKHDCDFDIAHTLVFSPSDSKDDIIKAVKNGNACIYEKKPSDSLPRIHGSRRLTQFGYFIEEVVYPKLQPHYSLEAQLMHDFIAGKSGAKEKLKALKGQTVKLKRAMYA